MSILIFQFDTSSLFFQSFI